VGLTDLGYDGCILNECDFPEDRGIRKSPRPKSGTWGTHIREVWKKKMADVGLAIDP
jgi:hypothetical protein